jgi:hypothetical protein
MGWGWVFRGVNPHVYRSLYVRVTALRSIGFITQPLLLIPYHAPTEPNPVLSDAGYSSQSQLGLQFSYFIG